MRSRGLDKFGKMGEVEEVGEGVSGRESSRGRDLEVRNRETFEEYKQSDVVE